MEHEEHDLYGSYDAERYIHYRDIRTGRYQAVDEKRNGKIIPVKKEIIEKKKLDFEDIKNINLDNFGQDVRTASDNFTLIHNYLLDYWSAIMGADAVLLYIHLKRYCYNGKDFCFPKMGTIRNKMKISSKTTINKHMDVLEAYGFIVKIYRYDKLNNNNSSTPFFKIRRYIPLLSNDLIDKLPNDLRKDHDKFLAKANNIELDESFDPDVFLEEMMKSAELMQSKTDKEKTEEYQQAGKMREYILSRMDHKQQNLHFTILNDLKEVVSKPSFETWFINTMFVGDEDTVTIYCPNSFLKDWIERVYTVPIKNILGNISYGNNISIIYKLHNSFE